MYLGISRYETHFNMLLIRVLEASSEKCLFHWLVRVRSQLRTAVALPILIL